ncbi:hypothetical protein F5148DRAFT_1148276 [Russula earlei]|uniref:Uncharacterized protein n=1 Tax=Russula earlei TaxID=71964 RepID=A0ACC0UD66_9AGAM|nr:hypothetical protein F5148DRAFT_1148276 [Russula earlei]
MASDSSRTTCATFEKFSSGTDSQTDTDSTWQGYHCPRLYGTSFTPPPSRTGFPHWLLSRRPYDTSLSFFLPQQGTRPHTLTTQDISFLETIVNDVFTFLQGIIRAGQSHHWADFNLWVDFHGRLSNALAAKRVLSAQKVRGYFEEIDVKALTGLDFPKGSWTLLSTEELKSSRGIADQQYLHDLYTDAMAPVDFDWDGAAAGQFNAEGSL